LQPNEAARQAVGGNERYHGNHYREKVNQAGKNDEIICIGIQLVQ
jgi:hypothetical protein